MISLEKLKEFREHILDLAIRGKLVDQRPEEGTAEDLYQQIQAEKQKLIEEGKLKKEKPLAPIEDDEIPFDIPDSWRWVRIGDLYKHNTGKALNSSNIEGKKLPYITTSNLYWNRFELNNLKKMFFKESEIEKCSVQKGDLLVCEGGDIGRAAIWNFDYQVCIQNHIHKLRGYIQLSTLFYYYIFLYYKLNNSISGRGIGIQGLSSNALHNLVVPLPPLAEQKRIVAKVESYLSVIEKAEELLKRKVDLDGQIKEKILQMAIQGKLVEQRPEEGTAEDLYQQIQAEKQKLIEEGKLKKEKPLAPIEDDEIPFDIPDSWRWVRIGDLYKHNTGKALNSSNIEGKKLPYITTSNLYWNRFELNNLKKMFFKESEIEKCSVQKGDLLVCEGGDIGRAAIWNFDYQVCIQNHIHKLRGYIQLSTLFYYYIFLYYKLNNSISGRGIGIQGLSSNALHNLVVPLPPLAEQKRIVAKVEELLALCDKLKLK